MPTIIFINIVFFLVRKERERVLLENHYIEQTVRDKVLLVTLFFNAPSISIQDIRDATGLSDQQVRQYCKELNQLFEDKLMINLNKTSIQIEVLALCPIEDFLYPLYNQSKILQLLRFFVTNPIQNGMSLAQFAKTQFISTASAYRLKDSLLPYIEKIGLSIEKNSIVGDEYRIRYLIAFLQTKFGIEVYQLSHKDKFIIRHFLFNGMTNLRASHLLSETFIFYDVLLALSWKRHDKDVFIPESQILNELKEIFIYNNLATSIREIIQPHTGMTFGQNDLDYLFLIYLTANNSFGAKKWSLEHSLKTRTIFENNPNFQQLLQSIQKLSPLFDKNHPELVRILIYFSVYFILNLQHLIPGHVRFPSHYYTGNIEVFQIINQTITQWLLSIGIKESNQQHLFLLCYHLEQLLKNALPPITIVLITTNYINIDLLKNIISSQISTKSVAFHSFHLLTDDIYKVKNLNPDLVISDQRLLPFIKKELAFNALTLDCSYADVNRFTTQLQKHILLLKEEKYAKIIAEQLTSSAK